MTTPANAPRISPESRTFLWWCGLRGGVAFALALHARQLLGGEVGEAIATSTLFVVAVSLIAIPPAIGPLTRRLGLERRAGGRESEFEGAGASSGGGAIVGDEDERAASATAAAGGAAAATVEAAKDVAPPAPTPERDSAPLLAASARTPTSAGAEASAAAAASQSSGFDERADFDAEQLLRSAIAYLRVR